MNDKDIIITDIETVREDTLYKNKPYIPAEKRKYHSIVYFINGSMNYIENDITHIVNQDDILIIKNGCIDISEPITYSAHYIHCNFITADELELSPAFLDYSNKVNNSAEYLSLFTAALMIWKQKFPGYKIKCREILYTIILRILSDNFQNNEAYFKYNKIRDAVYKIGSDYGNRQLSIQYLAELCGMSCGNLNRIFKETLKITPAEYLLNTRIDNAKLLICNTNNTISEIALQVGYSDIYSFSRAFKRVTGVTPSKWY
jgi:AraC-like DNA-binding protein